MAYTCPHIDGSYKCRYWSESGEKYYSEGATLPTAGYEDHLEIYFSSADWSQRDNGGDHVTASYNRANYNDSGVAGWEFISYMNVYDFEIPSSINGKKVTDIPTLLKSGGSRDRISNYNRIIPSSIKNMVSLFRYQNLLTGIIRINANPTMFDNWLSGTNLPIKLSGESSMLEELASSYSNVTAYKRISASFLVQRCDSDGTLNDEGVHAKATLKIKGDPTNVTYNATFRVGDHNRNLSFALTGVSEETKTVIFSDLTFSESETVPFSIDVKSYFTGDISETGLLETVTLSDTLTQAFFTMDFGNEGRQIAFGRSANADPSEVPDNGRFDCAMDVNFEAGLKKDGIDIPTSIFKTSKTSSNLTINANGYLTSETITLTRTDGAVPVGIVGYFVDGTNRTLMNLNRLNLSTAEANRAVVTFDIRNTSSSKVTNCTVKVDVLWVK